MSWHNGSSVRRFTAAQQRLAEEYRAAGMTEEQIEEILAFDREILRSDRRFYRHIQQLSPGGAPEEGPEPAEDGRDFPLSGRMDWLLEIESPALRECLAEADPALLEILTLWVFEGCSMEKTARRMCCSRQNISEIIGHFRERVKKRMEEQDRG